jgi:gliding motility-associated lipoprotein GldH
MRKPVSTFALLIFSTLFFAACDRNMVYEEFVRINNSSWHWDNPAEFTFETEDTAGFHDILIHLRHSTDYPLSNLYMFVHVEGPSGQEMTDTINFILAENSGKWIGSGIGNMRAIGYLYKKNTVFPQQGEYEITIEQAMRLPEVPVSEIGVRIEKVNP